jgi:hypothetical protein
VVKTISGDPINGPWDMTAVDQGPFVTLFVTNVLNGTVAASGATVNQGTVVRLTLLAIPGLTPAVLNEQVIATGFPERTDPAALVVGPTGLALGHTGTLFVADSVGNRIAAIPDAFSRGHAFEDNQGGGVGDNQGGDFGANRIAGVGDNQGGGRGESQDSGVSDNRGAGRGDSSRREFARESRGLLRGHDDRGGVRTVFAGPPLNDPLGATLAPNGDILTANGNDGNIVETSPNGRHVTAVGADQAGGAGVLFGLTVAHHTFGVYFVDDGDNSLRLLAP